MPPARRLSAVPADTAPPPAKRAPRRVSVATAAGSGDRRRMLVALRTRLAGAIDDADTPARDLASLSRRVMEIGREIDALDAAAEVEAEQAAAVRADEPLDPTSL